VTSLPLWAYFGVFGATLAAVLFLTPFALVVARRLDILDHPVGHKAQECPVPYLGGASIVLAFSAAVLAAALIRPPTSGLGELAVLVGLGSGLSVLGLVDDLRGLGPWLRLALEIAAGVGVWWTGTATQLTVHRPVDAVFTVLWVVLVTNSFNLLDNMDGLSAGVAAIASVAFFVVAYLNGQFLVATLAIALAGCAAGFLRHNFHPARIYMGDAGSLFIGFLLSVLALRLRTHMATRITFLVPVVILGVALFDTALVVTNRLIHRRSPISGGRDHSSHRLTFVGIPVPMSVSIIYAAAVALGWLGIVMSRIDRTTGFILMGLVLVIAVFFGVVLSLVPVYETSRRRRLVIQEVPPPEPPHEVTARLEQPVALSGLSEVDVRRTAESM
jgi:UDP-GlcNAc:undecaprenyl-phosphate GlcNAc-1-phosphate transferase